MEKSTEGVSVALPSDSVFGQIWISRWETGKVKPVFAKMSSLSVLYVFSFTSCCNSSEVDRAMDFRWGDDGSVSFLSIFSKNQQFFLNRPKKAFFHIVELSLNKHISFNFTKTMDEKICETLKLLFVAKTNILLDLFPTEIFKFDQKTQLHAWKPQKFMGHR